MEAIKELKRELIGDIKMEFLTILKGSATRIKTESKCDIKSESYSQWTSLNSGPPENRISRRN